MVFERNEFTEDAMGSLKNTARSLSPIILLIITNKSKFDTHAEMFD